MNGTDTCAMRFFCISIKITSENLQIAKKNFNPVQSSHYIDRITLLKAFGIFSTDLRWQAVTPIDPY